MNSDHAALADRLKILAQSAGGTAALARACDMPQRTMANYTDGKSEPRASDAVKIARVAGVRLEWLLTGEGAVRADEPGSGVVPFPITPWKETASALNRNLLEQVIAQVEEWLENNGRVLPPHQKSAVFTELYEMAMEDCNEGEATSDPKKVGRILRLMTG
ncbi:helix-turn-helix domain-containing protein [Azospirillum argentinense]|uniref:Helix-turn-helix domain-containing protein n=1 Tax=Azospirillum argentinense TaxID=2970906 RepID=A0ABW8VGS8_9PROT